MADMYDRLDQILKERGMSRRQLAIAAGIPLSTMSNLFARRTKAPSLGTLKKISDTLGVPLNAFAAPDELERVKPKLISITVTGLEEARRQFVKAQQEELRKSADTLKPLIGEEAAKQASELLYHFVKLNTAGQKKAIEILDDMTSIPKYQIFHDVFPDEQ